MRELHHWLSIAGMSPHSYCGDEEDGRIGLSSWLSRKAKSNAQKVIDIGLKCRSYRVRNIAISVVCFAALVDNFLNLKEKKATHSHVYPFLKIYNHKKNHMNKLF